MPTAELTLSADISGLRKQLESIPGLTAEQARAMAAELNKSFKASESAAKKAAEASKKAMEETRSSADKAAKAASDLGDKFGKVGSNSAKLAGALSMVSPELGEVARGIADIADVGEVGAAFSTLGFAATAATAVIALFGAGLLPIGQLLAEERQRAEEAAAAIDRFTESHEAAGQAASGMADALRSVSDEIKLKTGLETSEDQAVRNKTEALNAQVQALKSAYDAENAAAQAVIDTNKAEYDSLYLKVRYTGATAEQTARFRELDGVIKGATESIKANNRQVEAASAIAKEQVSTLSAIAEAEKAAREKEERRRRAQEAAAKAAAIRAEKERESAAAIKAAEDAVAKAEADYAKWNEEVERNTRAFEENQRVIAMKHVSALDDLNSRYKMLVPDEPLDKLDQLATIIADATIGMHRAPTEEMGQRYADMAAKAQAAMQRLQEESKKTFSLKDAEEFFAKVATYGNQLFGDLAEVSSYFQDQAQTDLKKAVKAREALGDNATEEEKKQADKRVKDAREAARKQFELTKTFQMAQIAVNTAAAATQALAGSPPPFNFIAMAAAIAAGGVQMATVMATQPKFHKGGLIGQPDEQTAIVRNGEAVLNPMARKALGDENIRDLNAGMGLAGTGGAVQIVYKHKAFDYFVREHLKTNATLPRALQSGRRLGHKGG